MLSALSKHIKDVSVLRRLLFAMSQLPHDLPNVWTLALEFATNGMEDKILDPKTTELILKNLEKMDLAAFQDDKTLFLELIATPSCKALGVVLIPQMTHCLICGDGLQQRKG